MQRFGAVRVLNKQARDKVAWCLVLCKDKVQGFGAWFGAKQG